MKKIILLPIFHFLMLIHLQAQITVTDADFEENMTYNWTSDNEYFLDGMVTIKSGSELFIESGTIIYGLATPSSGDYPSMLVVAKDAQLFAIGASDCPIIFTSEIDDVNDPTDLDSQDKGLWGGIVLCGNAQIARPGGVDNFEISLPNPTPYLAYGGADDEDNSGILRYVSIRHAGQEIGVGNQINGLTLAGIGNNTTIEYVEAYACSDDGFEFLGGTVDAKYLISSYCGDDAFDIDYGYRGRGQYWYGVQSNGFGHGLEIDGAKPDNEDPISNPTLSNLTIIGDGIDNGGTNISTIIMRDRTAGSFYNSIFQNQAQFGINIESLNALFGDESSFTNLQNGDIIFANNIWFDYPTGNDPNNFLLISGDAGDPSHLDTLVDHFNNNGNEVIDPMLTAPCVITPICSNPLPQSGSPALNGALVLTDPFFDSVSYRGAFGTNNWTQNWSALNEVSLANSCAGIAQNTSVKITVQKDENGNCSPDMGEIGLKGWIIKINTPDYSFFVSTDGSGEYNGFAPLTATDAQLFPFNSLWNVCQTTIPLTDLGIAGATNAAFSAEPFLDCPLMSVDLSTTLLRRCFENVYVVNYCNEGTDIALDARVEVELDSFLIVNSTTVPYTINADGKYVFEVGDVDFNDCGSFKINVTVSCDATLGETHCSSAAIFPDTICNPAVSSALIEVTSECVGNDVVFTLENIGSENMGDEANYIVTEDHVMLMQGSTNTSFQLNIGQTKTVTLPANGSTYHLQTIKRPGFPEFGVITNGIEACGTNGNGTFSTGLLTGFSLAASTQNVAIDCQDNIGSYDPNDKTAYPTGLLDERYLRANTDVEYRIRFQNTGTDTAFTVVIVDTLSEYFDLTSIRMGAASHDYEWSLDSNTLTFTFENIMLPDSNINEPLSHGFIKFKISQQPDLPDGIMITNYADIYFDFNDPIRTNEEFYTIGQPLETDVLSIFDFYPSQKIIKVFPNPFRSSTTIDLEETWVKDGQLSIFDTMGQMIFSQNFSGNRIEFQKKSLPIGIYFFKVEGDGKEIGVGKLIVR